jgi:uncharacterized RDD family membrane protein YckC
MSATKHLLRWKGRQSGPFAAEEIRGRLQSSEIGLMHEVQVDGQWLTVEKFLAQSAPRPPAPLAPKPEKRAPAPPPKKVEEPPQPPAFNLPPPPPPAPALLSHPPVETAFFGVTESPEMADLGEPSAETLLYGGFWLRGVAAAIDGAILSALFWAAAAILLVISGGSRASVPGWLPTFVGALYIVGSWLYFALMESSEVQATLGKQAVGLIVTDLAGERITFTHATGRYLGKLLSTLTLGVGYFMAAFTERKQALHDLMAGCHVLLRVPDTRLFQP